MSRSLPPVGLTSERKRQKTEKVSKESFRKKVAGVIDNARTLFSFEGLQTPLKFVSTFYRDEFVDDRSLFRNVIEEKNVRMFKEFEEKYRDVYCKFLGMQKTVRLLKRKCEEVEKNLNVHQEKTMKYVSKVKMIREKREDRTKQKNAIEDFLEKFQLTDRERKVLIGGNIESEEFFVTLNKVYDIQMNCRNMLREKHFKAPLEVMSEMSMYQNAAYDRLGRWIQEKCHYSDSFFEEKLKMAIKTLFDRPILLKNCIDEIVEARRNFVRQFFFEALQQKERPIELKAHDSVRYVADILAWIHQHVASEKEMIKFLFTFDDGKKSTEKKAREIVDEMLGLIFEVLVIPVQNSVAHIITPAKDSLLKKDMVVFFRLSHLLEFYATSIGKFMGEKVIFYKLIAKLKDDCMKQFFAILEKDVKEMESVCFKSKMEDSLVPPKIISSSLSKLNEIMSTFNHSIISKKRRKEDFENVLNKILGSVLLCLQKIANLSTDKKGIYGKPECDVFLLNGYCRIISTLQKYSFTENRVEKMKELIDTRERSFVFQQSAELINTCGFRKKIQMIKEWKKKGKKEHLSKVEGFGKDSLVLFVQKFYSSLYNLGTLVFSTGYCEKIENSKLKNIMRSKVLLALSNAYEMFYSALTLKESGITNPTELVFHSPKQVRALLEI